MLSFVLRRILLAIPTLIAIVFVVFVVARLAPSSPIDIMMGGKGTPAAKKALEHAYGLDRPIGVQFVSYLGGLLHGDFGLSFEQRGEPVSHIVARSFPVTLQLAFQALLFALALGLPLGTLAALNHNRFLDRAAMTFVVALVSVPSFVLGPLLVLAFAVKLRLFPVSGWNSPLYTVLPTIALGARSAASIARFLRASLLETLSQDYIRTAMAKGLSRGQAVLKHALKNALLPVLTVTGITLGSLLTGSFVVETIFQVPGLGYESIHAISARDYPVIQAMTLLAAFGFVIANLLTDILYGLIDPRVRAQLGGKI